MIVRNEEAIFWPQTEPKGWDNPKFQIVCHQGEINSQETKENQKNQLGNMQPEEQAS